MKRSRYVVEVLMVLVLMSCAPQVGKIQVYDYKSMDKDTRRVHKRVEKFIERCIQEQYPVVIDRGTRIDSVRVNKQQRLIDIYLNARFGYRPWRENTVSQVYSALKKRLGRSYKSYRVTVYSKEFPLEELVPNYYRSDTLRYDRRRMPAIDGRTLPLVMNLDRAWYPKKGLFNRNIALWHSHGWYYEQSLNRWEWQRARLFRTVEDIGPIAFTLPYVVPMLENAGATVFLPRERDIQTHEIIIDNDTPMDWETFYMEENRDIRGDWYFRSDSSGFAVGDPPYGPGENPFRQGTWRSMPADSIATAEISWIPDFPETGDYAVYVSYAMSDSNVTDAHYTVYHTGGQTRFLINQQIGGGTWIYLGTFRFQAGYNPDIGRVSLTNQSAEVGRRVTADAVRFGGGMGNIARNGMTSGRPRFEEGARYYLQYAGMPDTLVFSLNNEESDYKDDYQSRGEWVNYLKGAPFGPNADRSHPGLGIPIDLSLAFHTDAGIARHDTVIGTLSIYATEGADSTTLFPDGMSRLANRDFADILQTQIVEDLRARWDPIWNRRGLWDRGYSEAYRPNVPAALLELLSHQSFLDMKFFHDPRFRFDVSRSIYKAMLRFLATQYNKDYIVQPLPVDHFQAMLSDSGTVTLSWQPVDDPLEPSAVPEKYVVYTRIEDNGWDNGRLVDEATFIISHLQPGIIYSYKVTAVNAGGESFPSEILSVCWYDQDVSPVLIVNAFDRVAPPAVVETERFLGFADFLDEGVPDRLDLGYTGQQYDFTPNSKWKDDDAPGHGASHADLETSVIAGNNFDYPRVHGNSLRAAGYAFCSASDEAVMDGMVNLHQFYAVDIILGEEKSTNWPKPGPRSMYEVWPESMRQAVTDYCLAGGNLFVTGAYIGTDIFARSEVDSSARDFINRILKMSWRTNHASRGGGVWCVDSTFMEFGTVFEFNTQPDRFLYAAESPDGIEPIDSTCTTILRYRENNVSAGIAYRDSVYALVAFGFPFETIKDTAMRNHLMQQVMIFFEDRQLATANINHTKLWEENALKPDEGNEPDN